VPFRPETPESRELISFSPLDFQGDNTTLVHWKPLQNGGELMLEVEWQALPALFSRLAQQDVQIAAFAIVPQGTALRLRLELAHAK
jgi:pilus assembly protein HofO